MARGRAELAVGQGTVLRVGLVCPYDLSKPGGVQSQVLGLREALARGEDEVFVLGPGLPDGVPGWDLGSTVGIPANGSVAPISLDPRVGTAIRTVARDLDLLHVHEPFMPMVGFAALRAGPPVVATFHAAASGLGRGFYKAVGPRMGGLLGRQVRRVTAVSATAAMHLPASLDHVIVPNGVDTSEFVPVSGSRGMRIAFLGRDEPRKGLGVLLEAWPSISEAVPGASLVVMGANRGTDGIEWLGVVDDETKAKVLGDVAVYVAPNTGGESFGVTLVEAMAAGAVVVASDLAAFKDVGGEAGVYFETGNAASLAAAVIGVLGDEDKRAALSEAGSNRASDFDWDRVARLYRDVYEEALSKK